MELQNFVRKPFPVTAVQVDFQNAYKVAEWCGGQVELKETRLLGGAGKGKMDLPTVTFKGTGDYRDKIFTAGLGDWVVELRGNFRVFKKAQFKATFDPAPKKDESQAEFCNDHSTVFANCSHLHEDNPAPADEAEEAAIAEQEKEEALHKAGQL